MDNKTLILLGLVVILGFVNARYGSNYNSHNRYQPSTRYNRHQPSYNSHHRTSYYGQWSQWGYWTSCTRTCGSHGEQRRYRTCRSGHQVLSNNRCHGSNVDRRKCNQRPCRSYRSPSRYNPHSNYRSNRRYAPTVRPHYNRRSHYQATRRPYYNRYQNTRRPYYAPRTRYNSGKYQYNRYGRY